MNDIARQRMCAQHLAAPAAGVRELVASMLAMQAQEYIDALWAVGQRVRGGTEAAVERALAAGEILRTHPMRGTHHFVARDDLPREQTWYRSIRVDGEGRVWVERMLAPGNLAVDV